MDSLFKGNFECLGSKNKIELKLKLKSKLTVVKIYGLNQNQWKVYGSKEVLVNIF